MATNLFEQIKEKKQGLQQIAGKAVSFGWIDRMRGDEIIEKVNNDKLTLGVIGQMKCGKSTFLNAFIFEDDVLPAATTPMTATLSVITYGPEKSLEAEFYSEKEWNELKMQADQSLENIKGDPLQESKIKAAKELIESSYQLGASLPSLLGKRKKDTLNKLIEYVGAKGKYVSITKSVTIYYPKEELKGVEIVDTPGFNDPIVSREQRTRDFLREADVVLLMLYAGRAFDATDSEIVFKDIRSVGVGKILIAVNKYDLNYHNGETNEKQLRNVEESIKTACKDYRDEIINELLLNSNPLLVSANMALMAKMSMNKITSDKVYNDHWKMSCDDFEISTQSQMLEKSLIGNLENAVLDVVLKSKEDILFKKHINTVLSAGNNLLSKFTTEKAECDNLVKDLALPDVRNS